MHFSWNPIKAAANERKHGVSFREAATVLRDPLSTTFPDEDHSQDEQRYLTIGISTAQNLLVVSHAGGGDEIRIISARRVTRQERQFYEEEKRP
ncbi:MAG: BrnT family toxin [Candidatus Binatia bacterium]